MKKNLYTLPLILFVLSLTLIHSGCKSDDEIVTPADQNVDKETTVSRNFVELVKIFADANSNTYLYLNDVPSTKCPSYYFDSTFFGAIIVNYGEFPFGCTGVDGVKRNGSYIITSQVFAGGDSIYSTLSFQGYKIDKYATNVDTNIIKVTGFMNFSTKKTSGTTYNFHANGEGAFTTNLGVSKTITVNSLNGTVNYNSLNITSDDSYSIYGSVKILDSGLGSTFDISVAQANALQISGNCQYPLSGIAKLLSGGVNTDCDFSPTSGTCDAIVKLTKGSTVKTVDLTNIDF